MKLYKLTGEFLALQQQIDQEEYPDIQKKLDEIEVRLADKIGNCAKMIKSLKSEQGAVEKEIQHLRARKQTLETTEKNLKEYVMNNLQQIGVDSLKVGIFKVNIQNSPLKIGCDDISRVDAEWVQTRTEKFIVKKDILKNFQETGEIPNGISITQGKHLRIY